MVRPDWYVTNVAVLAPGVGGQSHSLPGVSIRLGASDDAAALGPLIASRRESLAWRLTRGDIVLIAQADGRVIGCTWLTSQPLRPSYFPIQVRPRKGEWYNYGLVVLPAFRGRGIGQALSRSAMAEARDQGGRLVFGHARARDRVAAASHAAAGFAGVEETFGITLVSRFVVVLHRRTLMTAHRQRSLPTARRRPGTRATLQKRGPG